MKEKERERFKDKRLNNNMIDMKEKYDLGAIIKRLSGKYLPYRRAEDDEAAREVTALDESGFIFNLSYVRMVICKCGAYSTIRTSWTNSNPGRRFYCCSRKVKNCGFICWLDQPLSPRSNDIICGLLKSKNDAEEACAIAIQQARRVKTILFLTWVSILQHVCREFPSTPIFYMRKFSSTDQHNIGLPMLHLPNAQNA
ncbi:hypothetical protein OSB04_028731 [Centaurea solstitialis]|uniref:GRF-type domain-containing protein n=1 Tax=Centaurea solstitialis TaxID=347529 RepID=A0AA38W808_9ASTR|nr:hypothetical protein OSB04_028731 [Centaurea solstitialis]